MIFQRTQDEGRSTAIARLLRTRDHPWILLSALLLLIGVGYSMATHAAINWDCAYYIQCGQWILDGKLPYVDFMDINPPLIMYVNVVPAFLARHLAMEPTLAFALCIDLLFALTLWQVHYLLPRADPGLRPDEKGLLALAWLAAGGAILLAVKWGQREHLYALTAIPYVLLRVARYRGSRVPTVLALALGLQAAVGACLKPHFLAALLGVELFLALTRRTGRRLPDPENLALAGFTLAYLLHWLVLPPAMREMYFGRWVPLALKHYDAGYGVGAGALVARLASRAFGFGIPLLPMLVATALALRPRKSATSLAGPLTVLAWLCLLAYLLQHKDWGYHLIPCFVASLLVAAALAVELGRVLESRVRGSVFATALVVWPFCAASIATPIATAWVVREAVRPAAPPAELLRLARVIDTWSRPGDPVLLVATSIWPAYPLLLQMNRAPGTRFCIFPVAFFYPDTGGSVAAPFSYNGRARMSLDERRILEDLQDDILTRRPRVLLIQDGPRSQGLPKGFHIFDYLVHAGVVGTLVPGRYRETEGPGGWRLLVPVDGVARSPAQLPVPPGR